MFAVRNLKCIPFGGPLPSDRDRPSQIGRAGFATVNPDLSNPEIPAPNRTNRGQGDGEPGNELTAPAYWKFESSPLQKVG
jgi:hypothetical protein